MPKQTIDRIEVRGRRVLLRVDFNVPLDEAGGITDDRRIAAALPTIRSIVDRGGRVVAMSHLGRPGGRGYEEAWSLRPAADRLRELLEGVRVTLAGPTPTSPEVAAAVRSLGDGEVVVLENLRFEPGEKKGDAAFAASLAALGDVYCNDAFGTAHREDASMCAVPQAMADRPRVAGYLLARELRFLSETIERGAAEGGFLAVLGGAKVSDKLGAIRHLRSRVDAILVGGAMAYTLLAARGVAVGSSRLERDMIDEARALLEGDGAPIMLPGDHVCAEELAAGAVTRVCAGPIADGWMGLDIGPATAAEYEQRVASARTVVWNGPMGVFETPPFDAGTRCVAEALAWATDNGATTVVGGGDSAAAIEAFGLADRVSHVSTGGGASLQMLEGRPFASVELLDEA